MTDVTKDENYSLIRILKTNLRIFTYHLKKMRSNHIFLKYKVNNFETYKTLKIIFKNEKIKADIKNLKKGF